MLTVLSPSKSLDFSNPVTTRKKSVPSFLSEASELVVDMRHLDANDMQSLMNISPELSEVNVERYATWGADKKQARQAAFAFRGDVYRGFEAESLSERDLTSAQRRLRILSGLYGLLKPLDLIHPYRMEMGLKFENRDGKSLYEYWSTKVSDQLNTELARHRTSVLVNLASSEYFHTIDSERIQSRVITCQFLELHNGTYRFMSYFGKFARGLMARFIVQQRIETLKGLKAFNAHGYRYSAEHSNAAQYVYVRDVRPSRSPS